MSAVRLYGSSIAIVSGCYSLYLSTLGMTMGASAWFMLVLGVVVLAHGVVLLTPLGGRLGMWSGIAMMVYAVLMLVNQGWMWTMESAGRGAMMRGMGWDPGMVAIAVLMLASGIIMTVRSEMM